ncbi:MAG: ABC transporter permease [Ilumatobacter sp.]|uniref:ABC transporter permease n=1 Tax=Ilumatobacter sp. TaxID=1967498 RepID=UPI003C746E7A
MFVYIARRIVGGVFVMVAASFILYILTTQAGDPLAFTLAITNPTQRASVISNVTETLSLDVHPVQRYLDWLRRLVVEQDFGLVSTTQQPVSEELSRRIPLTLKLVTAATILSIVLGVATGMISALRQYSGFDYLVTFTTFLFFSLPVFWVAVILKAWGGINLNDWLRDGAHFSVTFIVVTAIVAGAIGASFAGGTGARKATTAAISAASTALLLSWMSSSQWLLDPGFGPVTYAVISAGIAVGVISVMSGWANKRARSAALITLGIGIVSYFPMQSVFDDAINIWMLLGWLAVAIGIATAVGYAVGGFDRGQSARTASIVAFLMGTLMFVDRMMQSWAAYSATSVIRNRPIKTIGDKEGRLDGSFWLIANDTFSHLFLPTAALMLISVASYTRFSRGSMLEVLDQDYIRTARAKGLTQRTVVVRHALRNALIPLATIVAFDISGIIGGAVITESVFQWDGMGRLFIDGLREIDPNRVMAFFVVTGTFAVVFNLLADIGYAFLDPRIRVGE